MKGEGLSIGKTEKIAKGIHEYVKQTTEKVRTLH